MAGFSDEQRKWLSQFLGNNARNTTATPPDADPRMGTLPGAPPAGTPDSDGTSPKGSGSPEHHHKPGIIDKALGLNPDRTFVEGVMEPFFGKPGDPGPLQAHPGDSTLAQTGRALGTFATLPLWGTGAVIAAALDHGNQILNEWGEIGPALDKGLNEPHADQQSEGSDVLKADPAGLKAVADAATQAAAGLKHGAEAAAQTATQAAQTAKQAVQDGVKTLGQGVQNAEQAVVQEAKEVVGTVEQAAQTATAKAGEVIESATSAVSEAASNTANAIEDAASGALDKMKGLF